MASNPIILATGTTSGPGAPGIDKTDLVAGETISISDAEGDNGGESYQWFLDDTPIDVAITLVNPGGPTPSFIVPADAENECGTILLRCVVNGVFTKTLRLTLGLPNTSSRIPHHEEETASNDGGNTKGWHKAQTEFMRSADKRLIYITAVDPSIGGGLAAPIGSLARRDNTGVGELWQKAAVADTGWVLVDGATPHTIGGAQHQVDTLANVNAKISDATLDDSGDARPPTAHSHTHASTTGQTTDDHHSQVHDLGGTDHGTATLAQLNAKVSDATLIDTTDSRLSDARVPTTHGLGGTEHSTATLAQLNAKVSDATLDDSGDARPPTAHSHTHASTTGQTTDDHHAEVHGLGGTEHSTATLAQLNAKVSDATLDDSGDARTPTAHGLGGTEHSTATLAQLNAKISDATLIDTGDSRLSDARVPTTHGLGGSEHSTSTLAQLNAKVSDATLIDTADSRLSDTRDADAIITTTGPTTMAVGAVADGEFLKRSGATIVGDPGGGAIYPPGHIDGLATSWFSITAVKIAVGTCRDSTNAHNLDVTATLTATISASGANGLDTGSEAANTWYALYVIGKTDGTVASLLSTSFTSPTMPSGYTFFRRVGAARNGAGSDFRKFVQRSRWWYWDDGTALGPLGGGAATTFTDVDCSIQAPDTADMALIHPVFRATSNNNILRFALAGSTVNHAEVRPGANLASTSIYSGMQMPLDSANIFRYKVTSATDIATVIMPGYHDPI